MILKIAETDVVFWFHFHRLANCRLKTVVYSNEYDSMYKNTSLDIKRISLTEKIIHKLIVVKSDIVRFASHWPVVLSRKEKYLRNPE